jgi:hypothetical protein
MPIVASESLNDSGRTAGAAFAAGAFLGLTFVNRMLLPIPPAAAIGNMIR